MRLIGFSRRSSIVRDQSLSGEEQCRRIEAACIAGGHELVDIVDVIETGYDQQDREQFNEVLNRVLSVEADGLIVYKLDRFARSVKGGLEIMDRLQEAGKQLVSVADNIDTTTPMGKAFFQLALVFSELERNTMVDRLSSAKKTLRQAGRYVGGKPPYGWDMVGPPGEGRLKPNVYEQDVLSWMGDAYAKGVGFADIAKTMNNKSVPTKYNGKKWTTQRVREILERKQLMATTA